jgi:hypothetical protein
LQVATIFYSLITFDANETAVGNSDHSIL